MRPNIVHAGSGLTEDGGGEEGVSVTPGAPDLRIESRKLFALGLDAWAGGDESLAAAIGKTRGYVADLKSGQRPVPFHAVLTLLDNPNAARVVLGRQCDLAGFAMPQPKATIVLTTGEARSFADTRRVCGPAIWAHVGAVLAAERGVELDLFDVAIDHALELGR
jgi:hypothetical protein